MDDTAERAKAIKSPQGETSKLSGHKGNMKREECSETNAR